MGGRCCWVSICTVWLLHSKRLNEYSNGSASKFPLSFNTLLWKLFGWFRRLQLWVTGNWLAALSRKWACSCITSYADFLVKHQITQVTQPSYSPDLAACDFWLFPKLKSPLKGKRFQTVNEIQENTMGQMMVIGRTVWLLSKVPTLKGTEASLSYVQCVLHLLQKNASIFPITWLDPFWTGHISTYIFICMYVYTYIYILLHTCAHLFKCTEEC